MTAVSKPRDLTAPAIVIAHGAWIDGAAWREVIALLQLRALTVVAVHNPLSSLAEDVDAVTRVINGQSTPVVLVGHGYGGTVITQAGNHASVSALVYVAAFAPDVGESTVDRRTEYPPPGCVARFKVDAGGYLYLAQDAVSEFLAPDLSTTDSLVLAAAQQPIRASALLDRVTAAAWRTKPSWYLLAEQDRMISPALQRRIANRIGARIVALRAAHAPFLSRPKETTDVILTAVDSVRISGHARASIAAPPDHR